MVDSIDALIRIDTLDPIEVSFMLHIEVLSFVFTLLPFTSTRLTASICFIRTLV
jgi:nitrate reductase gamma subunit